MSAIGDFMAKIGIPPRDETDDDRRILYGDPDAPPRPGILNPPTKPFADGLPPGEFRKHYLGEFPPAPDREPDRQAAGARPPAVPPLRINPAYHVQAWEFWGPSPIRPRPFLRNAMLTLRTKAAPESEIAENQSL